MTRATGLGVMASCFVHPVHHLPAASRYCSSYSYLRIHFGLSRFHVSFRSFPETFWPMERNHYPSSRTYVHPS